MMTRWLCGLASLFAAGLALCPIGAQAAPKVLGAADLAAAVRPALNASRRAPVPSFRAPSGSERPEGMAQTSIERRFDRERVSGAVGFLCGRPDSLSGTGGAALYGTDPHGRFVGARLSIALR